MQQPDQTAQAVLHGLGTQGFAEGKVVVLRSETKSLSSNAHSFHSVQEEIALLHKAVASTRDALLQYAQQEAIFEAHVALLDDPSFAEALERPIQEQQLVASNAVAVGCEELVAMFADIDDEYLKARTEDIKDICRQIIQQLQNEDFTPNKPVLPAEGAILVAHELSPSDIINLPTHALRGIITETGSVTGHVCIIASSKGIPTVVGVKNICSLIHDDDTIAMDAAQGLIYVNPNADLLRQFEQQKAKFQSFTKEEKSLLASAIILGNAGNTDDVQAAILQGAKGIGLYRTEFLFLHNTHWPTEQEQYTAYKAALTACSGLPITFRTLDIGGDKPLPYATPLTEANPALGLRGIRFALAHPDIFKCQLRALLRASAHGPLRIMLPLVTTVEEIASAQQLINLCKEELQREGYPLAAEIPLGVMIETPAAVWSAAEMAKLVQFFSIGTNDLTQYTMAADRGNDSVAGYCQPSQPALWKAIEATIHAAKETGISVCVCGEMAANPTHALQLIRRGIKQLSVSPGLISQLLTNIY